jgi:hypothetical protein
LSSSHGDRDLQRAPFAPGGHTDRFDLHCQPVEQHDYTGEHIRVVPGRYYELQALSLAKIQNGFEMNSSGRACNIVTGRDLLTFTPNRAQMEFLCTTLFLPSLVDWLFKEVDTSISRASNQFVSQTGS